MNTTTTKPASATQSTCNETRVSDALAAYLERYDLGDGGYTDDWSVFTFGWVPVMLPNTDGRKKALRAHDMHHLATGCNAVYDEGELDLVAYELRSGGPGSFYLMGWMILLHLFALGTLVRPRHLFRLFVRARGTRNLFGKTVGEEIYGLSVGELRERLGLTRKGLVWNARDAMEFLGWTLLSHTLVGVELGLFAGLLYLGTTLF
jgi:hypothetical protein